MRRLLLLLRFTVVALAVGASVVVASRAGVAGAMQRSDRRWTACGEFAWKVHENVDVATRRQVNRAVNQFIRATRLRFEFAGVASDEEFSSPPRNTLVIGFDESLQATRIAGLASLWYLPSNEGAKTISGARIGINPRVKSASRFGFPTLVPVVLHELGHVAGLDHVDDPADLMYPYVIDQRSYRPRDVELLRRQVAGGLCSAGSVGSKR
jgi:hypothetical protein